MKARLEGAIVIKSIDGKSSRVTARTPPSDYTPPVPTEQDRALVRALLRAREASAFTTTPSPTEDR
jgi:hypothetical protein